jgi:hypothetical protein
MAEVFERLPVGAQSCLPPASEKVPHEPLYSIVICQTSVYV